MQLDDGFRFARDHGARHVPALDDAARVEAVLAGDAADAVLCFRGKLNVSVVEELEEFGCEFEVLARRVFVPLGGRRVGGGREVWVGEEARRAGGRRVASEDVVALGGVVGRRGWQGLGRHLVGAIPRGGKRVGFLYLARGFGGWHGRVGNF